MKSPIEKLSTGLNTMTLTGLSLLWGHMLGLINTWFIPLTVFCLLVGMGQEIKLKKEV